jgi:MFS family permease
MPEERSLSRKRLAMYAIGFVLSLASALPTYVSSSYLSGFIGERLVGVIYAVASIVAIAAFIEMPALLRKVGTLRVALLLVTLELASFGALSFGIDALSVIAAFIINFVSISLIHFTLDIFLEELSPNARTGKIRGTYLALTNLAWLVSPLIVSHIIGDGAYGKIFAASGILVLPATALLFASFRKVREPDQGRLPFWKSFGEVWSDRDIKGTLMIQLLLQFFYAWMIIYIPIYLHETVGFGWDEIGVIFTVMLLPFVILQAPLGRLADRAGEKLILGAGFGIMGVSTCLIAFVTDHDPFIWALILFMTRVGAAMVEVMVDTYFFKKIDASKTNVISFYRTARPIAYVVAPLAATLLFTVFDMRGLFIFLGLLMFYGLRYSLAIADTR